MSYLLALSIVLTLSFFYVTFKLYNLSYEADDLSKEVARLETAYLNVTQENGCLRNKLVQYRRLLKESRQLIQAKNTTNAVEILKRRYRSRKKTTRRKKS